MDFQRARTRAQIDTRRREILNACEELFQEREYDDITLKAIAERTSISRTSLYSYYQTKEDVFMELLEREYLDWCGALEEQLKREEPMTAEELCAFLTNSTLERTTMRRLLSVNLIDIEKNCSFERLVRFKTEAARPVRDVMDKLVRRTFPQADEEALERFENLFYLMLFNLYPFSHPTERQMEACRNAHISEEPIDERDLCVTSLMALASTTMRENARA